MSRERCRCGRRHVGLTLDTPTGPIHVTGCPVHAAPGTKTAEALAEIARAVREMSADELDDPEAARGGTVKSCTGVFGRWFGHKYEERFDEVFGPGAEFWKNLDAYYRKHRRPS